MGGGISAATTGGKTVVTVPTGAGGVTSVSGTAPIVSSGGTTPAISITQSGIDHGSIGGLTDDDHTQYHTDGRALTWLGTRSTTDLPEGTRLYYTDARARLALSGTSPISYDNSTGVISLTQSAIDHGSIGGLTDDDHTQYALLAGRSGGQTLYGGTASGNNLTLASTSHSTKGKIFFGALSTYDEVNERLGVGTTTPGNRFNVVLSDTGVASVTASSTSMTLTPSSDITSGSIISAGLSSVVTTTGTASLTALQIRGLSFIVGHSGDGTLSSALGATGAVRLSGAGSISAATGIVGNIQPDAGSTGTYVSATSIRGSANLASLSTTQTIGTLRGVATSTTGLPAGATITEYSGFRVERPTGSGTFADTYGLHIENMTTASGTHTNVPYGLYQAGTSDRNYFGSIVGIGTTSPAAVLHLSKALSSTAWLGNGIGIRVAAATYTDTTSSGTVANTQVHVIGTPTIAASSSTTFTTTATFYITNAPTSGTNVTQTNPFAFWIDNGNFRHDGSISLGITTTPQARLHIAAGTATAGTAPIRLTSGTSLTAAVAGTIEFTTDDLFFTITTGAARKAFVLDDGTRLTSGRVPFATTNGRLTDDSDMTFATDTLTVTKIVGTTSVKVGTAAGFISSDGSTGATGSFTTADAKTVTVKDGIITSIV